MYSSLSTRLLGLEQNALIQAKLCFGEEEKNSLLVQTNVKLGFSYEKLLNRMAFLTCELHKPIPVHCTVYRAGRAWKRLTSGK